MSSEEILQEVAAEVSTCARCGLCKGRTHAVPGEGNAHARVLFIGEGPGYHEDKQARPFVGPSGQLLDELLKSINLKRSDVFIANVVKCRPPANRDPLPEEIAACGDYLDRQIAAIKPLVIVTLGRFSMAKFFPGEKISAIHGRPRKRGNYICMPLFHPAAALRQPTFNEGLRQDFKKIPLVIAKAEQLAAEAAQKAPAPSLFESIEPSSPSAPSIPVVQAQPEDEPPQQLSLF